MKKKDRYVHPMNTDVDDGKNFPKVDAYQGLEPRVEQTTMCFYPAEP